MSVGLGVSAVVDVPTIDQALVFAMSYDKLAQCLGPQHGFFHHLWLLYALSIVRESDDIGAIPSKSANTSPFSPTVMAP